MLLLPFLLFVILVTGVRGRRATSNVTLFALALSLVDVGLVTWARAGTGATYRTAYQWINVPTAFTGAQAFQGFGIDISIRVDHAALAEVGVLVLLTLGAVLWHRGAGRTGALGTETAGPARVHALLALGLLGATGVVLSGDLAALVAWWGLAGVATYLLLASRFGTEATGRASRRGLAVPFLGDAALLAGVAILYSRYGQLDLDRLGYPALRHTYGTGLKALGVVAVLVALAALVRGGLFPFTGWMTATLGAPPAAVAWVQGAWTLLPVVLAVRALPFFVAAGPEPFRILAYAAAGAALAGAAAALADNQLRRSLTWAGSAVTALLLLGIGQPGAAVPALAGALAAALARPVVAGAAASVAGAMRSGDLLDMGEGWRRMRRTALALGTALIVLSLAAVPKAAALAGWRNAWVMAVLMVLAAAALLRPYAAAAHLELRRRRAFEPTRVREVAGLAAAAGLGLAALSALALVLALVPAGPAWLGGARPAGPGALTVLAWLLVGLAGAAAGLVPVILRGRGLLGLSARAEAGAAAWWAVAAGRADALGRAGLTLLDAVEGRGIAGGESALGRSLAGAGLPAFPAGATLGLALGLLVALAVAGALLAPQVAR